MSIVRWGQDGSSVYVFCFENKRQRPGLWHHIDAEYMCCGCIMRFRPRDGDISGRPWRMVLHLLRHRLKGHTVPFDAFKRLLVGPWS